jgi:hypothetical protein
MARRRFVQCRHTGKLIEVSKDYVQPREQHGVHILPDIEAFKSPVDGTVVSSRSKLREHNRRNNVVQTKELEGEGREARREREKLFTGGKYDREGRIEAIKRALYAHGFRD